MDMKVLAISQRVESIEEYSEIRDSLDQKWTGLITRLNFLTVPLPNLVSPVDFIELIKPSVIILSGGNTISKVDSSDSSSSINRDKFEQDILQTAIEKSIKIIGVCRGMQMINLFFNGSVSKSENHVRINHNINFIDNFSNFKPRLVNSYHNWCISQSDLGDSLQPLALAEDNTIESFYHKDYPIFGIMWHPERVDPYNIDDINLLKKFVEL